MAGYADDQGSHPRQHALAIASATHLHKQGYMSSADRDKVHTKARKHLKKKKPKAAPAMFGSLAPPPMPMPTQGAGHYMSTPTPTGDDEGGM